MWHAKLILLPMARPFNEMNIKIENMLLWLINNPIELIMFKNADIVIIIFPELKKTNNNDILKYKKFY